MVMVVAKTVVRPKKGMRVRRLGSGQMGSLDGLREPGCGGNVAQFRRLEVSGVERLSVKHTWPFSGSSVCETREQHFLA